MIEFCANIVIILQSRFIFNSFLGKFKIKECLMWQSGIVAKGQNKSATSLGDCGRGEINMFLFRLRVGRGPCNS